MLNMEPRLVSVEMDVILYQSYEFYLDRDNARMLAEAQLIWFNPDGLNMEICEEPYNSSVVRVVLTTLVDLQCREITDSFYLKQENTNLLDKKSETTDFKNGFAMIGVGDEEFDKPVGEMLAKVDDDETASQESTVKVSAEGFDTVEGDGEEEFANPVLKKLLKNVNIQILDVEDRTGIGDL